VMSELDPSDLASALRVNVYGAYNLTLAAWGALKERRSGRVVFVGSGHMFGSYGDLGLIPQAAAKAAVVGLTRSFACVGRTNGIRVNAVFPA
ncbi:SDR family oxidoreductase, partial [Escherichia coli]|uniref:SDR family oxidoreductase n=1 Tax=Escherichia coli TaxID=562 RepID=UPI0013D7BF49